MLATTVQPGTPPPALSRQDAQTVAFWSMVVALVGLLAVVALLSVALQRRRSRERELKREAQRRREDAKKPRPDPWAEAGRRAGSPPPDEPESPTRVAPEPQASAGAARRPVALITGAARRVGRACALELARAGCDIVFTYHSSEDDARELARELAAMGTVVSFHRLDLSDLTAVGAFAAERAEMMHALDILVHNASVYEPSPIDELTPEGITRQYRVNAAAPLILTAGFAPLLRASGLNGGGSVIAFADIHSMGRPRRNFSAYSMSKAALAEMIYSLARDLAPDVRVNGVAPGVVAWPEGGADADPDTQAKYLRRIPLGRAGTPEDAARVVRWLALEATYVTGEIVRVDGGRWLT
ncbi:MAG: SDR family oxidoreductase [Planctomycetota bacterium]|nr:SDR family oxidoreductase [Planctomycetota bacterium]